MADGEWYDDVVFPALLMSARSTYRQAIRATLSAGGFNDLPRRGAAVVGGIARNGPATLAGLREGLHASDAFVAHLLDTLEDRGYVEQTGDGDDLVVTLTDRGRAAAATSRVAVQGVDAELAARVGLHAVSETRRVLGAMITLSDA